VAFGIHASRPSTKRLKMHHPCPATGDLLQSADYKVNLIVDFQAQGFAGHFEASGSDPVWLARLGFEDR
jgi:hypothetical protein